jgi:hypothetical protein
MKYVLLSVLALSVSACSALKDVVPFLSSTDQIESIIAVTVAGTYTVTVTKDGQTLIVETWDCTQKDGKLTGCHKRQ